jgi:hypothetical protein
MSKARGAQQARSRDVVDEIGKADQAGAGEQDQASTDQLRARALQPRRRISKSALLGIVFPMGVFDSGGIHTMSDEAENPAAFQDRFFLEQTEMHDGQYRAARGAGKVVERLLPDSERKADGIRYGNVASILQSSVH